MQWNLMKLRKEAGLSREYMAKILDITTWAYAQKENGKYEFKMNEMFIISRFFNKPMEEIFLPNKCNDIANNVGEVHCECNS